VGSFPFNFLLAEIYFSRSLIVQRLMQALVIVEIQISFQALSRRFWRALVVQIDFFIFDRSPQPLGEDVIQGSPLAVHTDLCPGFFEQPYIRCAREVRTLIGVENFWHRDLKGAAHRGLHKTHLQALG
jgi:hypothetical protein